jgi:ferredoxin
MKRSKQIVKARRKKCHGRRTPPTYHRHESGRTWRTKSELNREKELQDLKEKAKAIELRLRSLVNWIEGIEKYPIPSVFIAFVDQDRCVGCGTCHDVCPADAISVDEIAKVDPKRCTGCGFCVNQCPRGALTLHPLNTGYGKAVRVAL